MHTTTSGLFFTFQFLLLLFIIIIYYFAVLVMGPRAMLPNALSIRELEPGSLVFIDRVSVSCPDQL